MICEQCCFSTQGCKNMNAFMQMESWYGARCKDFVAAPTPKQVQYAKNLAKRNDIDLSDVPFTKKAYSEFITEWKEWN